MVFGVVWVVICCGILGGYWFFLSFSFSVRIMMFIMVLVSGIFRVIVRLFMLVLVRVVGWKSRVEVVCGWSCWGIWVFVDFGVGFFGFFWICCLEVGG